MFSSASYHRVLFDDFTFTRYFIGVLRLVYGGIDVGKYVCSHNGIDAIHLTGSDKTYDAIVWGKTFHIRIYYKHKNSY